MFSLKYGPIRAVFMINSTTIKIVNIVSSKPTIEESITNIPKSSTNVNFKE